MASSSVSQEDLENDFELTSRRSRIRTARARTVNPSRLDTSADGEDTMFNLKGSDTLNITSCMLPDHDASPKPMSRSKEKRTSRCVPIRQPLTDHINRANHLNKGKQQRDRRKLREKRRSTGVVHLQSTESTGGSTGEDEDEALSASLETKKNTQHNEHQNAEERLPPKSFSHRRAKSPSDLDADDEDNQNQSDSTVSSLVQMVDTAARPRPGTPTGAIPEELLERAQEENRRLLSLLEERDHKIVTLEKRIFQIQHENALEKEMLREENATLLRAMSSLKSK